MGDYVFWTDSFNPSSFQEAVSKVQKSLGGMQHSNEKSHIFMDASQLHIESWS